MSTVESIAPDASPEATPTSLAKWLARLDHWCERGGDSINPILVKETRQLLKSRQFVVTFSLILFAALAWTVAGSLSMMPQIYTSPSAPRMMIGYYAVLALPMMLVVPLAAYRSLESEIDDGTLELLSITTLSPWQIVLGKLASASLQMVLYFVTLFPCLAYAYSLRGVDLPTTLLIVGSLAVAGLLLTVAGLFFAPLAKARTGRISSMLALILLLLFAEYAVSMMVVSMIFYGNPLSQSQLMYIVFSAIGFSIAVGHLMLTATAAQLTPETENRSTPLRLSLLAFTVTSIVIMALGVLIFREGGLAIYLGGVALLGFLWTFSSALMVAERPTITPRIRRELPSSFLARLFLTWLTPGPTTGLVFSITAIAILMVMQQFSLSWITNQGFIVGPRGMQVRRLFADVGILYPAYLISYLVVVRMVMWGVRLRNNPRVEIGIAAIVVVAVMSALIPYSVQLHFNDYQQLTYDPIWQVTNWAFTITTAMDRGVPPEQISRVVAAAVALSLISIFAAWQTTRPRRTATPDRVEQEMNLAKQ